MRRSYRTTSSALMVFSRKENCSAVSKKKIVTRRGRSRILEWARVSRRHSRSQSVNQYSFNKRHVKTQHNVRATITIKTTCLRLIWVFIQHACNKTDVLNVQGAGVSVCGVSDSDSGSLWLWVSLVESSMWMAQRRRTNVLSKVVSLNLGVCSC